MSLSIKRLKEKVIAFKSDLKQYPHKDIAEYSRLIDALEDFEEFGYWPDTVKAYVVDGPADADDL